VKAWRVVLMACAVLVWSGAHPAAAQTIKLGTLAPEGSPWYKAIQDMAETWKRADGGKIQFRIYPGGVAGDDTDMVRKMRVGQLHAAALSGHGLYEIAPDIQALMMPMMLASDDELTYVRDRLAPRLEATLEARGFKVLNWGEAGWVHFFAQTPVVHPDDLKPLRLFAWSGNPVFAEVWRDAGYHPVELAATDIMMALQSGLINAFPTTPLAALSFQWFGLAKHMTALKWAPLVGATVISTRKWQEIPEDLRPILLQAARETGVRMGQVTRHLDGDAVETMKKYGLVVHPVPPEIYGEWETRTRAQYPKILGKAVPADLVAEVERLRDEYRASQAGR
jgi:TRAP-type C4-dicarboxylate transport system substrate-binding protein